MDVVAYFKSVDAIETIQNDIGCPQCDYNLRGLHGDIVTCPECGHLCDIAEIVTRRWNLPWHKAPGLTQINLPVAWVCLVGWVVPLFSFHGDAMLKLLVFFTFFSVYILLFVSAWHAFHDAEAVWLSLLSHVIMAGYIGSIPLGIYLIVKANGTMTGGANARGTALVVAGLVVAIGGLVLGRIGERFVASRCIRHYLKRGPRG